MIKENILYCKTIGHSTYDFNFFIELIKSHNINCIVDVRSSPYSRHNPQFNRETLLSELKAYHIQYIYMGELLGARYDDPVVLFTDGKVDFIKVSKLETFQRGIQRVIDGIKKGYYIALLCAEKDPLNCHRFVLVSRELSKKGIHVDHVISQTEIVTQADLEDRLIKQYKKDDPQLELFNPSKSRAELLDEVYQLRNKDIAYNGNFNKGDGE